MKPGIFLKQMSTSVFKIIIWTRLLLLQKVRWPLMRYTIYSDKSHYERITADDALPE